MILPSLLELINAQSTLSQDLIELRWMHQEAKATTIQTANEPVDLGELATPFSVSSIDDLWDRISVSPYWIGALFFTGGGDALSVVDPELVHRRVGLPTGVLDIQRRLRPEMATDDPTHLALTLHLAVERNLSVLGPPIYEIFRGTRSAPLRTAAAEALRRLAPELGVPDLPRCRSPRAAEDCPRSDVVILGDTRHLPSIRTVLDHRRRRLVRDGIHDFGLAAFNVPRSAVARSQMFADLPTFVVYELSRWLGDWRIDRFALGIRLSDSGTVESVWATFCGAFDAERTGSALDGLGLRTLSLGGRNRIIDDLDRISWQVTGERMILQIGAREEWENPRLDMARFMHSLEATAWSVPGFVLYLPFRSRALPVRLRSLDVDCRIHVELRDAKIAATGHFRRIDGGELSRISLVDALDDALERCVAALDRPELRSGQWSNLCRSLRPWRISDRDGELLCRVEFEDVDASRIVEMLGELGIH